MWGHRIWVLGLLFSSAMPWFSTGQSTTVWAGPADGKNDKNRKQDEKRENQRVEKAKKDVQQNQNELNGLASDLRSQLAAWQKAEAGMRAAQTDLKRQREMAEEQLDDESGYPSLLRRIRETRVKLDAVSKPILESVQKSSEWLAARSEADLAKAEHRRLREDVSIPDGELKGQLEKLEKVMQKPDRLAAQAVAAVPEARELQTTLDQQLEDLEELRRKYPQSKIDQNPKVVKAKESLAAAQRTLEGSAKTLASARTQYNKQLAQMAAAKDELARAQRADQADTNKSRPKGKK